MTQLHYKAILQKVLLGCLTEPDPVLAMLRWVADQMMRIESENKVGAAKGAQSKERKTYFSGSRVRRMVRSLLPVRMRAP